MLLGTLSAPGSLATPAAPTSIAGASTPTGAAATTSTAPSAVPAATASAGTCAATNGSGGSPRPAALPLSPAPSTTGPSPLFNSQVEPFASFTGPYAYVAGGAALRDQGYGLINLTWPGAPSTSSLVAAYLIWSIINDTAPPTSATLNGIPLNGTWTAYATPSPCWLPLYIYTFAADVTNDVVNGVNNLTNVPSGVTNGLDPWSQTQNLLLDDGASLVAIYEPAAPTTIHQVTVYTGALPVAGAGPIAHLNYSAANAAAATTTYIVADGQLPGNAASWNGTQIDANAFPGDDPHESTARWSYGNLSDTKTFNVSVAIGSNTTSAQVSTSGSDCITWVGQVLSVEVPALKGPYSVVFSEQGLPNGTNWNITTHSTTRSGTVVAAASSLRFTLANGSYPYTVGSIPGFVATTGGSITVLGGPVFLRVIFHELLYPVVFNETGLPTNAAWWVKITNVTQGIAVNLTTYAPLGISVFEGNGSYQFSDGELGLYRGLPMSGSFNVTGGRVALTITYIPPPLYRVTLREVGLPRGTTWGGTYVSNWVDSYNRTTNATFSVLLPNTTVYLSDTLYPYAVTGYQAPSYLAFAVSGAPETVDVNYSILYNVTLVESGLAPGTYWYASLVSATYSYYYANGNTTHLYFAAPNGSFAWTLSPLWSYTATPPSGTFNVSGKNVTVPIVFSLSPTYALTFTETGLAPGALWSVEVILPTYREFTTNSTSTTLTLLEPNGSYYFSPLAAGYSVNPFSGNAFIDGSNVSEPVTFTKVYFVDFVESGLPSGTSWYVDLAYVYGESYSPTIRFAEANGTYADLFFTIGSYSPPFSGGSVTVAGANQIVYVNYTSATSPTYGVTFTESGLTAGTNWSVDLNGYLATSTGPSDAFTEANGSFDFYIGGAIGYSASPASGTVVVAGAAVSEPIGFLTSTAVFEVTFAETGLPMGSTWFVNITGQPGLTATVSASSGTTVQVDLLNGSYSYVAATSATGWTTPATDGFTVAGAALNEPIPFSSSSVPQYGVTFTESGLPSGATWYVNISGELSLSATVAGSSGTTVSINLPDGSYRYTAATNDPSWTTPTSGDFTVAGAAIDEPVPFTSTSVAEYAVTFTESGLPAGATWYVNITGEPGLQATLSSGSGTTVLIELPNAEYNYAVSTNSRSWAPPPHGSFTVSGANLNEPLPFTSNAPSAATYVVTFTETGLPSGATWYVNISGEAPLSATVAGSTGTSLTVSLANGTYDYAAATNSKNWTTLSGSFTLAGAGTDRTVPFTAPGTSQTASGSSFPFVWLTLGIVIILLVVGLLIFLLGRRRRKDRRPPPGTPADPASPPAGPASGAATGPAAGPDSGRSS
jgi:hypothetical protein